MAREEDFNTESYEEKLHYVNSRLFIIKKRCIDHNKSQSEIFNASKPFINEIKLKKNNKHDRNRRFLIFKISICVAVVSLLIYNDTVNTFVWALSRLVGLKVLPLWDWRYLYNVQCFIPNPLVNDTDHFVTLDDCKICTNLTEIAILSTTSIEEVSREYIDQNLPVIITEGQGHQRGKDISVFDLYTLYTEDTTLKLYFACDFLSDIQLDDGNHRTLLKMIHKQEVTQYHAHWRNCFKESAKVLRQLYRRPSYLPSTIELAETNWIFISKDARLKQEALPVDIGGHFLVLIQLSGHIDVTLTPVDVCSGVCTGVTATLHAGSILLYPYLLYEVSYLPSDGEESVTIGMGGIYDH